jgi:hypothetical protein
MTEATATVEQRVQQYVQVRDALKALDEAHEKKRAPYVELQNALGGWLQQFLTNAAATSIKTECGTVYSTTRYSASLADSEAFMNYVITNNKFELMDRRANATAVKDFVKDTGGLPPGCNLTAHVTVGVRRKTGGKADE